MGDKISILPNPSLIAVGDEVCSLLSVGRGDLAAVDEESDEAAAEEAVTTDQVPAEDPLELGEGCTRWRRETDCTSTSGTDCWVETLHDQHVSDLVAELVLAGEREHHETSNNVREHVETEEDVAPLPPLGRRTRRQGR